MLRKVSIIMPVLNEAAIIAEAIESAIQQSGAHELIVSDGGSDDSTCAVVARSEARLVRLPAGSPPDTGRQINLGAENATGDILLFLHCDVTLPPGAAELVSGVFVDPRVIGGGFLPAFGSPPAFGGPPAIGRPIPAGERIPLGFVERMWQLRTRAFHWFAGDTAPFIRADTFRRSGGYPTTGFASDWDFAAKLRSLGALAVIPATVRVDARRHLLNGVLKTLCVTGSVELMYRLGADRRFLRNWYRKWLPSERQMQESTVVPEPQYISEEEP